ncbi:glycosyltransferase [uncultured Pseudodesulfovibrio sp.]|uniref:glycosyltransferase n=1 Tax=uncultured Pseudodesulfovibrio sp. TaxID=2035858 RepID=UPI0029C62914|nr:glycosyltransferase [uncultured Pseudodesulfovibrio sp.]
MNILIVVWNLTLGRGGRQRAGAALANDMFRRGHKCTVLVNDTTPAPPLFPLEKGIGLIHIDTSNHLEYRDKLLRHNNDSLFHESVRRRILAASPDAVLVMSSSREILMWPAILKGTGIPLIFSERTDPSFMTPFCWGSREERLAVLSAADLIHFQMEGFRSYYPSFLQDRLRAIPNQVSQSTTVSDPTGKNQSPKIIINVARMDEHKHQPLLARAFRLIAMDYPDWELHFWGGEGKLAEDLKQTIVDAGVAGRAHVHNTTDTVGEKLSQAQIFAFPSEFEGCPNALLEAMAHGLPSIGYAQCGGTNEILLNGTNGLLFDELTPHSIAQALKTLLDDEALRENMGKAAQETSKQFSPEKVFDKYEKLFMEATRFKNKTRLNSPCVTDEEAQCRKTLEHLYSLQWI